MEMMMMKKERSFPMIDRRKSLGRTLMMAEAMTATMATTMVPMATIGKRIERRGGAVRRSVKVRANEGGVRDGGRPLVGWVDGSDRARRCRSREARAWGSGARGDWERRRD